MGKENGFEFTPKEGGIGMPEQKNCPYVPVHVGSCRFVSVRAGSCRFVSVRVGVS